MGLSLIDWGRITSFVRKSLIGQGAIVGPPGPAGRDGLTTSVNGIEHINGNITLTAADIGAADASIVGALNDTLQARLEGTA